MFSFLLFSTPSAVLTTISCDNSKGILFSPSTAYFNINKHITVMINASITTTTEKRIVLFSFVPKSYIKYCMPLSCTIF